MARKGYDGEYRAKKEIEKKYGVSTAVKFAIGGSADYLVISKGELICVVEVKVTKKNKYYPSEREKKQIEEIIKFAKLQEVPAYLWIYFKKGKGKPVIKHELVLYS